MCTSPISIRYSNLFTYRTGYRSILVPCGKCCECKKKYQNDWMLRINEEMKSCGNLAVFVTLTYAPEHVPTVVDKETGATYYSVCKRHCQNVIKRFRTNWMRSHGKKSPLRYFLTSEYGPRTCRPHYHAIFFGVTPEDILPLINDWQRNFGFVKFDQISGHPTAVAKYVSKYCSKGVFECPYVKLGYVAPTFHLMSKGLGRSFVENSDVLRFYRDWKRVDKWKDFDKRIYSDKFLDFVGFRLRMSLDGFSYSFPRYYKIKLYGQSNNLSNQVADFVFRENMRVFDEKCAKLQAERSCTYREAANALRRYESDEMEQREKSCAEYLERFYNKSKL